MRVLKIKILAIKYIGKMHSLHHHSCSGDENIDRLAPIKEKKAKSNMNIEPVDIREIDEESMAYDISQSESHMENESNNISSNPKIQASVNKSFELNWEQIVGHNLEKADKEKASKVVSTTMNQLRLRIDECPTFEWKKFYSTFNRYDIFRSGIISKEDLVQVVIELVNTPVVNERGIKPKKNKKCIFERSATEK